MQMFLVKILVLLAQAFLGLPKNRFYMCPYSMIVIERAV